MIPKFKIQYALLALVVAVVAGGIWLYSWAQVTMGPGEQAITALEAVGDVDVTVGEDVITFMPVGVEPHTGLIFYPAERVDYRSYARPLRQIAASGYLVVSVRAPMNLMIFDPNRADEIIQQYPQIEHWAVGGHSMGGAMAANYVYTHPGAVEGLVLWAAYPFKNNNLSKADVKALSIYGTLDMSGTEPFENSGPLMPEQTTWVTIRNGNRSQFGDYGIQPGDTVKAVHAVHQQALAMAATVKFLGSLGQ